MLSNSPIFVVGMPRSGTTLMSAMLSSHPNIAISPETHFLCRWMRDYPDLDVRRLKDFYRFWRYFSQSKQFAHLQIEPGVTRRQILALPERDFRQVFMTILQNYAKSIGKTRWGEKTPMHEQYIDVLLDWFPQAKIIYVLRDPRAVIASLLKVPWATWTIGDYALHWRASVYNIGRWSTDTRVQVARYENLVQAPKYELVRVCSFLAEEYQPSMLAYGEAAKNLVCGEPWKVDALQSATTKNIDNWKGQLSPQDVSIIEHFIGQDMLVHGYEPITPGPGLLQVSRLRLIRIVSSVRQLTLKSSRRWAKRLLKQPANMFCPPTRLHKTPEERTVNKYRQFLDSFLMVVSN